MIISKKITLLSFALYSFCISLPDAKAAYHYYLDDKSQQEINTVLKNKSHSIEEISKQFLNTPYQSDTLIGSSTQPEKMVVNLNAVDCFTFIDYVLALSLSNNVDAFIENLIRVRYIDGTISFYNRKHFFSDWYYIAPKNAEEITKKISPNSITVFKRLNEKPDGTEYLAGIGAIPRNINYIPSSYVNEAVISKLKTGDFIGIYTNQVGLDASHVGILIKKGNQVYFRNASSLKKNRKVVDSPFLEYIKNKPGIMVLRTQQN
ncbi:DUF1460 domain-containing protein [Commensalibacter papalotli (ex Botero et al. 2024)]|uniref:DUF1460 domain-containing protein n=1 Tax=Commensalibacter papalotli (ex Botero et al. 2024) TaxID=2972766 RepID=A0ABM9HK90_9PROT|nr:DUF1460 domain-containing protein [Commensalibacter papalotli (ex Botero et al. 2024)]CAI3922977.1 unnamed protein product [Commensalibacter papalotli (ex Botero et al. 2024)]CAI3929049.1 unnamed protein product [Commensalibacter papalotli (ex Botero et al. 2024)]